MKNLYITWACFRTEVGVSLISISVFQVHAKKRAQ